jgi:hypothetical protein
VTTLDEQGFALWPAVVASEVVTALVRAVQPLLDARGTGAGARNLLDLPFICDLARSLRTLVTPVLGDCAAVRALLFDKTPDANWKIRWHQDHIIAVVEMREVPGYLGWSEKAGVPHVQPPVEVLQRMLSLRVHLDECGPDNGPLRVLPGSHRVGALGPAEVAAWIERVEPVTCVAQAGDVLAFRPLLLHSSLPALVATHRRVVQIEYAAGPLPGGLAWRWAIG